VARGPLIFIVLIDDLRLTTLAHKFLDDTTINSKRHCVRNAVYSRCICRVVWHDWHVTSKDSTVVQTHLVFILHTYYDCQIAVVMVFVYLFTCGDWV